MSDGGEFIEIDTAATTWRFERAFLTSDWRCIHGQGCRGILPEDAESLQQGCCSYGAHLGDGDEGRAEALDIAALAATLTSEQWQHRHLLVDGGPAALFADERREHTAVVDGACVFLNRPGFGRGAGCALHVGALDAGDSPIDWKPSVCWQLPIRVDWEAGGDDTEVATVRRWRRDDWGGFGETMAWCCTERDEGGEAYGGAETVFTSLHDELTRLVGEPVVVRLGRALADPEPGSVKIS